MGARLPVVVVWTSVIDPMVYFDWPGYLINTLSEPTALMVYLACLFAGGWTVYSWMKRRRARPTSVPITPPPAP